MATSRLAIYNGALADCGEQRLATLTENREPRYLLDDVWNDGGVRFCLEQAQWHFAMRSQRIDFEPSLTPDWGFQKVFTKPSDWVETSGVFQDEFMQWPLTRYADEIGFWYCDLEQIFVKFVSDDSSYGSDLSKWPYSFTEYVKAYFASKIIRKMPGGAAKIDDLEHPRTGLVARRLLTAKNKAAMTQPATFPSCGSWVRARLRNTGGYGNDGGNPNALIG